MGVWASPLCRNGVGRQRLFPRLRTLLLMMEGLLGQERYRLAIFPQAVRLPLTWNKALPRQEKNTQQAFALPRLWMPQNPFLIPVPHYLYTITKAANDGLTPADNGGPLFFSDGIKCRWRLAFFMGSVPVAS